jgi:hypothetical protein
MYRWLFPVSQREMRHLLPDRLARYRNFQLDLHRFVSPFSSFTHQSVGADIAPFVPQLATPSAALAKPPHPTASPAPTPPSSLTPDPAFRARVPTRPSPSTGPASPAIPIARPAVGWPSTSAQLALRADRSERTADAYPSAQRTNGSIRRRGLALLAIVSCPVLRPLI